MVQRRVAQFISSRYPNRSSVTNAPRTQLENYKKEGKKYTSPFSIKILHGGVSIDGKAVNSNEKTTC